MDIVQEQLEREYNLSLIATAPILWSTRTHADVTGQVYEIDNPAKMPTPHELEKVEEPMVTATIIVPQEYLDAADELCTDRRGYL